MCNVILEKLNFGRLQWIALNSSEKHLIYGADEFRGESLWIEELNWNTMKESG